MPADRLLGTLIRSLQTYTDQQDTPRLLGTAASLLDSLQNPLNITLLTSQLLTAPALWHRPDGGLQACLRLIGVFHAAAQAIVKREDEEARDAATVWYQPPQQGMPRDAWVRAVSKGADDRSPRWKHGIVFAGLLLGFGPAEHERLGYATRGMLEQELVRSVNLGLEETRMGESDLAGQCIALVLNHTFPMLPDIERALIDYDLLLPVLLGSAFFSDEGLEGAYFLAAIELNISRSPDNKLLWKENSPSFRHVMALLNRPLVTSLGPLSRLISHTVENVKNSGLVQTMVTDLTGFCKALIAQWRQNRLSSVDLQEEASALAEETQRVTAPQLWKLLRSCLFSLTIVFRGAIGRLLGDRMLASDSVAPEFVCQVLHGLRHLYFITSRIGTNSFTQYTFVYLTSIDILCNYPPQAEQFLHSIAPSNLAIIPSSPVDRALALYFLNTAEHFTLILTPQTNEDLLVASALPYLVPGNAKHLLPLFEAAHSVILAVLSAPQSAHTTAKHTPFYVDALFSAFPANLSPRQFRLAFKTLLRVASPPSSLSATYPDLPAILLEILNHRTLHAPNTPLPQPPELTSPLSPDLAPAPPPPLSEQAVLCLTLLDSLPFLSLNLLEDWLPLAAQLVNAIPPGSMKEECRSRFWEVMLSGEMDPDRALVAVGWWNTRGGREAVMGTVVGTVFAAAPVPVPSQEIDEVMSGGAGPAAVDESKL